MTKIVVFANGEEGDEQTQREISEKVDLIICADGGANHALKFGLIPNLVIGDLDSLENKTVSELEERNVRIIRYPSDKDETDLELALDYALQQKADVVTICCAFGERIDHMLGNILVASLPKYSRMRITLTDGCSEVSVIRGGENLQLNRSKHFSLSLIPLSPVATGVSLRGAKWVLQNESLYLGSTRSLSNVFESETVGISLETGLLLAVSSPYGKRLFI